MTVRRWMPHGISSRIDGRGAGASACRRPRHALDTVHRGRPLKDLALEVLRIAEGGLARRARNDRWGDDETHFINTLLEVVESGETPATKLLKLYHGEWKGDIDRVFAEFSY